MKIFAGVTALFFLAFGGAHANPAHNQIAALSESQRQTLMTKFLSGERCGKVTRTFHQGSDARGNAFWSVGCSQGESYQIMIFNDAKGSTRLLDCKLLKAVNAGTCFTKFKS